MDKYYYFVSQLPYLQFKQYLKGFNSSDFITEAEKWVSENDLKLLLGIDVDNAEIHSTDPCVLKEYKEFIAGLKKKIGEYRIAHSKGHDLKLQEPLDTILGEGNPYEVEIKLMHLKWEYIAELEILHNFDIDTLVIYLLKLKILERLSFFDKDKGSKTFYELSSILVQ